jgi:hypothetical protein
MPPGTPAGAPPARCGGSSRRRSSWSASSTPRRASRWCATCWRRSASSPFAAASAGPHPGRAGGVGRPPGRGQRRAGALRGAAGDLGRGGGALAPAHRPGPRRLELTFTASLFSAGSPIYVQLAGGDLELLQGIADRVKAELGRYPGVQDVTDTYRPGKEEVELSITPEAEAAGLTLAGVGRQVRQAFFGEEAQRVQRGRDDVRVMVRCRARAGAASAGSRTCASAPPTASRSPTQPRSSPAPRAGRRRSSASTGGGCWRSPPASTPRWPTPTR